MVCTGWPRDLPGVGGGVWTPSPPAAKTREKKIACSGAALLFEFAELLQKTLTITGEAKSERKFGVLIAPGPPHPPGEKLGLLSNFCPPLYNSSKDKIKLEGAGPVVTHV